MPSSGYGIVDIIPCGTDEEMRTHHAKVTRLNERAKVAMQHGMFLEWLESFLAAWEKTKDVDEASLAGLVEWDL